MTFHECRIIRGPSLLPRAQLSLILPLSRSHLSPAPPSTMQRYPSSPRRGRSRADILRSRVRQVDSFYRRLAYIFQQLGASPDEIQAWQEDMDRILFPLPSCQYCKPTYSKYVNVKPWWRVTREEFLYIAEVEEMILRGRMKDRRNPLEYVSFQQEIRFILETS